VHEKPEGKSFVAKLGETSRNQPESSECPADAGVDIKYEKWRCIVWKNDRTARSIGCQFLYSNSGGDLDVLLRLRA
jgi:hypothetical protein